MATSKIMNLLSIKEKGTNGNWTYFKYSDGTVEAFANINFGTVAASAWTSGLYYANRTLSIPSGIFSETPTHIFATSQNDQWSVCGITPTSATQAALRCITGASGSPTMLIQFHAIGK